MDIEQTKNENESFVTYPKLGKTELFEHTMIPVNNPISMIKSGIKRSFNLEDNLKDKNENINHQLGDIRLPQIDEYQSKAFNYYLELIAKFLNAKKLVQMTDGSGNKVVS